MCWSARCMSGVQVLQPSLCFKHSPGCHYGLITMSVWLMIQGTTLIVLSNCATTIPTILLSWLEPCLKVVVALQWMWRLYMQLIKRVVPPAGNIKTALTHHDVLIRREEPTVCSPRPLWRLQCNSHSQLFSGQTSSALMEKAIEHIFWFTSHTGIPEKIAKWLWNMLQMVNNGEQIDSCMNQI